MSSWLDLLPSSERQKLREIRKRSPEEYEKLRERIKSVDQIAEEMERSGQLAELEFALETEPKIKEALKQQIERDLAEQGIEAVIDVAPQQSAALESGNFDVRVETHPETNQDQLAIVPEGSVSEVLPIQSSLSEQYVTQFIQAMSEE